MFRPESLDQESRPEGGDENLRDVFARAEEGLTPIPDEVTVGDIKDLEREFGMDTAALEEYLKNSEER